MKNDVVPVDIRGILPANSGCAIFLGNDQKVFVIQVEHNMGAIIGMFLRDTPAAFVSGSHRTLMPVIFTTARLWTLEGALSDADLKTGDLDPVKCDAKAVP